MRIALAQVNPTVGDLSGNAAQVESYIHQARETGCQLVLFPELVICGYPPEDLLLKEHFVHDCWQTLSKVACGCRDVVAIVGCPVRENHVVYNAAAVLGKGTVQAIYRKICLPNYGVFDEKRYFCPGESLVVLTIDGVRLAVTICEDMWVEDGPAQAAALEGQAQIVVNLSMSPYHMGKGAKRETVLSQIAKQCGVHICYVNGVGGQDELVFDGHSMVLAPDGKLAARAAQFEEELLVVEVEVNRGSGTSQRASTAARWPVEVYDLSSAASEVREVPGESGEDNARARMAPQSPRIAPSLEAEAEVYEALCLGLRDYVKKNDFDHVVVGLSGGIDSALAACIAVDALGGDCVTGVFMPSRYTSGGASSDARELAVRLGVDFLEIPIEPIFEAYLDSLAPHFGGRAADTTEQNIQARIRANLLMALSNKFGWLVLTTGNKSEMAVGYTTLYGDMAGGFAVLKDVPKTLVYRLANYCNRREGQEGPIPASIMTRPPSAELAAGQTDQDTLPPYEILDQIVEAYVVDDESIAQIAARGIVRDLVERVVAMIDRNEYKRRQAAPGVRITPKAFGKDRRLPITNRYRG